MKIKFVSGTNTQGGLYVVPLCNTKIFHLHIFTDLVKRLNNDISARDKQLKEEKRNGSELKVMFLSFFIS